jgi:hypothetical protein
MALGTRRVTGFLGFLLFVFGALCLNYTNFDDAPHHREVALERNWPPPSMPIFYGGVVCVALGAGTLGYAIGKSRAQLAAPTGSDSQA